MKCSETFSPENKVKETLNLLSKITCYHVTGSQRDQGLKSCSANADLVRFRSNTLRL